MSDPELRISDADREQAASALAAHSAEGRLTLDELAERIDGVHAAATRRDLDRVLVDLPPAPAPASRRRATRFTLGVFAHAVRRGRLRLARWTWVGSLLADVDLDLRSARLDGPQTSVLVLAVFGNVDLYVPEAVEVDVSGLPLGGHCRSWGRDSAPPGAPFVRVRVLTLFGTADVWRVPTGTKGDFGHVIKLVRAQQKELEA